MSQEGEQVKHTPGPWEVAPGNAMPWRLYVTMAGYPMRVGAVEVAEICDPQSGRAAADARLIATAPDLLQASIDAAEAVNAYIERCDLANDRKHELWPVVAMLRSRIAKAEGKGATS
jgi:hypothetical protein